ncbi:MAG TPA: response regulator transcription factor [Actinomycetes bacterium]|nr:response regulator transcription factor [Actinomycetes bacterium]
MIRVLVAEDQGMMRGALVQLLDLEDDLEIVAQVARGDEIVPAALDARPDIAVVDIELPGTDGIEAARLLRAAVPTCAVVIVTTFGRPGYLRRAFDAGARAFLVKDAPVESLAQAIRRVMAGETVVDPDLAASALVLGANPLTDRERDVLRVAAGGAPLAEVARLLHLSESTVRNYLSSAIGKTGTRNRTEATRVAASNGWL